MTSQFWSGKCAHTEREWNKKKKRDDNKQKCTNDNYEEQKKKKTKSQHHRPSVFSGDDGMGEWEEKTAAIDVEMIMIKK